jgi:hypothetical protein
MKKIALLISLSMIVCAVFSQKNLPSLKLRSYQRGYISGVAPTATIELGGKETAAPAAKYNPEYFIYLIAYKVPYLKIERVWIKQQLYLASIDRVTKLPIVLQEGKKKDTLVKYTDELVWQIKILGKDTTGLKPKKDIATQVKANELVIRLNDPSGHVYTRTSKHINMLEATRGQ